ncbi:zinc finger-like domain-containing protein [Streptomyces zaomyceticus]|uniref:zinc finger-like domain-containing protein n=1 Tax=Streptomyces zaomyceticus TaxID=68286 RepID=UPI001675F64C|nr:zinc finger-like domain-containing protein [Streptomyces zaomyceticus]GHG24825.1 replication initiation protein [Streptomyces zaomyceticus]
MPRDLDLRHVISPAVRDLIELANLDNFDRTRDQITRLHGCTRPINLVGHTTTRNAATGETIRSYSTSDEPTGRLLTTCGNRRASRCPACSRTYAADTYHLVRAGLCGGKDVSETVRAHPRVFLTLTAPSFGPVHNRPTTKDGKSYACRCGIHHLDGAPELGTPLHPKTYDYTGAVLWNAHAGALWARFTLNLRRALAAHFSITQKDMKPVLRVSFAKVAEYQKRGLVHFHAVVRFDGPDGHTSAPPAWATVGDLRTAIATVVESTTLTVTSDTIGDQEISWGKKFRADEITALGDGELTDAAVAGYVAKYATKNAEDSGTVERSLICRTCSGRGTVGGRVKDLCPDCEGTRQAEPLKDLPVHRHVRQMIRTAWDLGGLPEFADLKLCKWAHMLGFRGHFSTKSRAYSTTLGALRDVRRAWRLAQADAARTRAGHPTPTPDTVLVTESSWAYLASGYRPGEELLAAQTRHDINQTRADKERAKTEGEVWQ